VGRRRPPPPPAAPRSEPASNAASLAPNRVSVALSDTANDENTHEDSVLLQDEPHSSIRDHGSIQEPSPKRRRLASGIPVIQSPPATRSTSQRNNNPRPNTRSEASKENRPTASEDSSEENDPTIVQSIETSADSAARTRGRTTAEVMVYQTPQTPQTTQVKKSRQKKAERDKWIVTTPAEISNKTASFTRPRKPNSKANSKEKAPQNSQPSVTTPASEAPSVSRRVANREKRIKRREALAQAQNGSLGEAIGAAPQQSSTQSNEAVEIEDLHPTQSVLIKKIRKRASTPEGAEHVTIVPSIVTMYDLASRDRRTGRKSERERKMRKIDWAAVKERRKQEEMARAFSKGGAQNGSEVDARDNRDRDGDAEVDIDAELERVKAKNSHRRQGIQIRVVNGEHVIDEQSQKLDRHALANKDIEILEEIEEDDLTKRFNSQTYINMKRRDENERITVRDRWNVEDTEKFYDCLSRFGTDFMVISKMFINRSRRHIRAKFVREERVNPTRIEEALSGAGRGKWDLEMFKREVVNEKDAEFLDPRVVEGELEARRKEREAEIEEKKKEMEEEKRQRKLAGDYSEDEDAEAAQYNSTTTLTKKNKSRDRHVRDEGNVEEVIEIVDDD
jgi:transcription factor TFIIIB component B''